MYNLPSAAAANAATAADDVVVCFNFLCANVKSKRFAGNCRPKTIFVFQD